MFVQRKYERDNATQAYLQRKGERENAGYGNVTLAMVTVTFQFCGIGPLRYPHVRNFVPIKIGMADWDNLKFNEKISYRILEGKPSSLDLIESAVAE